MRCMAADVADSKDPLQADVGQLNAFWRPSSPKNIARAAQEHRTAVVDLCRMDPTDFDLIARLD